MFVYFEIAISMSLQHRIPAMMHKKKKLYDGGYFIRHLSLKQRAKRRDIHTAAPVC